MKIYDKAIGEIVRPKKKKNVDPPTISTKPVLNFRCIGF